MTLDDELRFYGLRLDAVAFRALVSRQFRSRFSAWSPDDLYFHPEARGRFVERVRAACGCPDLPEHLILRALH